MASITLHAILITAISIIDGTVFLTSFMAIDNHLAHHQTGLLYRLRSSNTGLHRDMLVDRGIYRSGWPWCPGRVHGLQQRQRG